MDAMPKWADVILIPLISILLAAILSALVILAIGENPWEALKLMVDGALGSTYGWGYTLYYATNFMFTGLAVPKTNAALEIANNDKCGEAEALTTLHCFCDAVDVDQLVREFAFFAIIFAFRTRHSILSFLLRTKRCTTLNL